MQDNNEKNIAAKFVFHLANTLYYLFFLIIERKTKIEEVKDESALVSIYRSYLQTVRKISLALPFASKELNDAKEITKEMLLEVINKTIKQ